MLLTVFKRSSQQIHTSHLHLNKQYLNNLVYTVVRSFAKKIRRKKAPVEALPNSPNSMVALLSERQLPKEMDLQEIWEHTTQSLRKSNQQSVDSTTRFEDQWEGVHDDNELLSTKPSVELTARDVNRYYELKKGLIQEAFREFYKAIGTDGTYEIPKRGCKALYDEVQLTGCTHVFYRKCIHDFIELVADSEPGKFWLEGKSGSGKSIALVSLVEWARLSNWFVLYIPSAIPLISDYFFAKRPNELQYDTIVAAKDILRSVHGIYGGDDSYPLSQLAHTLPTKLDQKFGNTLEDLCKTGISSSDPEIACHAVVHLLEEVLYGHHDVKRLVVVDDYNALYWKTKYFHWEDQDHKDPIPPDQLTLVNAFRLFDSTKPVTGHLVAASTYSGEISPRVQVPKSDAFEEIQIPYFTESELSCVLFHYWKRNFIQPLAATDIKKLFAITGGNLQEIRRSLSVL